MAGDLCVVSPPQSKALSADSVVSPPQSKALSADSVVQIVYGRSGSGKTEFMCRELIARSVANSSKHYYMIVPEQFTMEMQKRMASMHPDGGIMDIDILSFVRLTYRVFEELHVKTAQVLEDIGKTMVISHLLAQHEDELLIFGKSSKRQGFHEEMKSMVCELFQYGIHREDVVRTMEGLAKDSVLYMKLSDLLLIYDSFEDYIAGHYIVAEQLLELVSGYVENSEKLKEAVLYFDGFTGFTPVQYGLLAKLLSVVSEIRISITMPEPSTVFQQEHHLFHMSYEMYEKVNKLASTHRGVELLEPVCIDMGKSSRLAGSEELMHLEQNIFMFPYKKWDRIPEDIHCFVARSSRDEMHRVAVEIQRLVREHGYRYRDIAVVTGDLSGVSYLASEMMPQYQIPYFIDESVDMRKNSFSSWVLSLWRIIAFDYHYEDIIAYIKTGYSESMAAEEAGLLENYALARNLKSRRGWQMTSNQPRVEVLRVAVMQELQTFRELINGSTVKDYLKAIYTFSVMLGLEKKLEVQAKKFEEQQEYALFGIYHQIYPKLMALFDKMADILGDEHMTLQEFYTVLETGIQSLDIGVIPSGIDQVTIGDITRTRLGDIKVLFLIDVNEGVIPKKGEKGMILNDRDRELLASGMSLAPGDKEKGYQEQFYLYLMLTKPKEKLFLSYHKLTSDNKAVRPSYLISRICAIFPKLREEEENPDICDVYTREDALKLLLHLLAEYTEDSESAAETETGNDKNILLCLLKFFQDSREEQMVLKGMSYPFVEADLPETLAKELYGSNVSASISRLEKYAGCAFSFFLQYGLKLSERKLFEINTADTGDILHKTMELVFSYFKEQAEGIRLASFEECEKKTREILSDIVHSDDYAEIFESSERNAYLHTILERVAVNSVHTIKRQLAAGVMVPEAFELPFGGRNNTYASFQLKEDVSMNLKGIVDRVDVLADEDKQELYVQVVDYKSGDKHIDYTKLYYGTQIQLIIYMNIVRAWAAKKYPGMKIVPVGMYYFHMHDPMLEEGVDDADIRASKMRLSGLTVADSNLVSLVDRGPGQVIEVAYKKDMTFTSRSKVAAKDNFEAICDYAYEKAWQLGKDMYGGCIAVNPYKYGQKTACDYCKFSGICLFDSGYRGNGYRYFKKKGQEVFQKDEVDR